MFKQAGSNNYFNDPNIELLESISIEPTREMKLWEHRMSLFPKDIVLASRRVAEQILANNTYDARYFKTVLEQLIIANSYCITRFNLHFPIPDDIRSSALELGFQVLLGAYEESVA